MGAGQRGPGQGEAVGGELVVAAGRSPFGPGVDVLPAGGEPADGLQPGQDGMDGAAGQPGRGAISTPYSSLAGSVSRACRTSWVGMVMRGVRCCSILVVYLAPRLNTSYFLRRGIKYRPPS